MVYNHCFAPRLSALDICPVEYNYVRYWSAPDHTRIVVDSDQPLSFKTIELKDPLRFVVNVEGAKTAFPHKNVEIGDSVAHRVRVGQFDKKTLRLVIDLVKPVQSTVFTLKQYSI